MKGILRQAWHYWGRLGVATWLLVGLALMTALGSLLPQLPPNPAAHAGWLRAAEDKFGPLARVMRASGLFSFFRSPWFWAPAGALTLSLFICALMRFRAVWRIGTGRVRRPTSEELSRYRCQVRIRTVDLAAARAVLSGGRSRTRETSVRGRIVLLDERNRLARLGTLATHLGPLLLLVGATISGLAGWRKSVIVSRPGEPVSVGPFAVRLDGWHVDTYPDGSPADYRADVAILQDGRVVREAPIRVNHPGRYRGVSLLLMGHTPSAGGDRVELLALHDPGYLLVIAAGVLLTAGVGTTFYLPHEQMWAWMADDGTMTLAGRTTGNQAGFARRLMRLAERTRQHVGTDPPSPPQADS